MKASPNINILHLEDNLADQVIFQENLSCTAYASAQVKVVESVQQLLHLQEEQYQPELVVADLNLPDSQGINTLDTVRKYYPSLPLIILTGAYSKDFGMDQAPTQNQLMLLKRFQNVTSLERAIFSLVQEAYHKPRASAKVIDPYDLLLANLELDITKLASEETINRTFENHPILQKKAKEMFGKKRKSL